ncbi:MAG: bifunctional ADP-heptose synthase [Cyclobacteriaceae bacterium]
MAFTSVNQIFEAFNNLNVLVIGDVMLDSYIWGRVDRISPEAPVPIIQVKKRDFRLGGAANVALNVKALGANPILCALAGEDEAGKKLLDCLDVEGLSRQGMIVSKARPTTIKTRVIASHQHVVRVDEESDAEINQDEESLLIKSIEQILPACQVVIFEDYDKGVINEKLIGATVKMAKKLGIPVVVDPKKRNFSSYKNVTLFKPNLKELREGLKIEVDPKDLDEVQKAVAKLKSELSASGVLVTLSEHGAFIDYQDQKVHVKAHVREIADVSGAGDTVVSIAGLCVALNLDSKLVAALANLGGGLVCQHTGVVPIDREELLTEALKERLI